MQASEGFLLQAVRNKLNQGLKDPMPKQFLSSPKVRNPNNVL